MDEQEKNMEKRESPDKPEPLENKKTGTAADTTPPEEALDSVNAALHSLGSSLDTLEAALHRVARSLESLKDARQTFSRLGWAVCVLLPVTFLLQIAAAVILTFTVPGWQDNWLLWAVSLVPFYGVAIPLALWILRSVPAHPPAERPLRPWRFASLFPVTLLLTYAGNIVSILFLYALSSAFGTSVDSPVEEALNSAAAPLLRDLIIVCVAPVAEEYVFRRVILDRTRVYGEKLALAVSAVLFGMVHGNLSQFLYAVLVGLVLGYVYLRTGRLRYTIALHMFVNFMGTVAAPLLLESGEDAAVNVFATVFGLLVLLFCGGGIAILAVSWRKVRFEEAERELPRGVRFRTAFLNPGMILMALSFIASSVLMLIE